MAGTVEAGVAVDGVDMAVDDIIEQSNWSLDDDSRIILLNSIE